MTQEKWTAKASAFPEGMQKILSKVPILYGSIKPPSGNCHKVLETGKPLPLFFKEHRESPNSDFTSHKYQLLPFSDLKKKKKDGFTSVL